MPSFKYTIGCDPELFLIDKAGNYVSAHNVLPGTKEAPHPIDYGAIQVDGTSAEFNITPAKTADEFLANIKAVLLGLDKKVHEVDPNLDLRVVPTAVFDPEYFEKLPVEAKVFGCDPDWSAYTQKQNIFEPTKEPFRTGAGHIHIGWIDKPEEQDPLEDKHFFDCTEVVKSLDATLYHMSLLWDDDDKRRTLYGKIGSFRPKRYGVEYRPLSNAWTADPDLQRWVFNATLRTMELLDNDVKLWHQAYLLYHVNKTLKGDKFLRSELLHLHDFMVRQFEMPELPAGYLGGAA